MADHIIDKDKLELSYRMKKRIPTLQPKKKKKKPVETHKCHVNGWPHWKVMNTTMQHIHTYTTIKSTHSSFLVDTSKYIFYAIICRLSMIAFHTIIETSSSVSNLQNQEELNTKVKRHQITKILRMKQSTRRWKRNSNLHIKFPNSLT